MLYRKFKKIKTFTAYYFYLLLSIVHKKLNDKFYQSYQSNQFPNKVSCFLDNSVLDSLSFLTNDLENFHPLLQEMLLSNQGIRKWEYGMMFYGLPSLIGKKILDIGSGPSLLPMYLAQKMNADVTILDLPNPYTIEEKKLRQRSQNFQINLELGDMKDIPFPDRSFDIVTSVSVIEHLSHSIDHSKITIYDEFIEQTKITLQEMYRVLRPGGWLYLTSEAYIPHLVDSDKWAGKLFKGNPYGAYPVNQLNNIFISTFEKLGACFPYPIFYEPNLLLQNSRYSSYRNPFMTAFNLFIMKPENN